MGYRHLLALLCALLAGTAAAEPPPSTSLPPSTIGPPGSQAPGLAPEVVVEAPLLTVLPDFVKQALPRLRTRQIARWHGDLCPAARGFFPQQEAAILARMSQLAKTVGIDTQPAGCQPNVLLLLTDRPDVLIEQLLDKQWRLFQPTATKDVRRVLMVGGPVRVWHEAETQLWDGRQMVMDNATGITTVPTVRMQSGQMSLIDPPVMSVMTRTLVIMDVNRVKGVPLDAVAAHLAMRILGPFGTDFDAQGLETILNLFQEGDGPQPAGLTAWDRSLLRELYKVRADQHINRQQRTIARRMAGVQGEDD